MNILESLPLISLEHNHDLARMSILTCPYDEVPKYRGLGTGVLYQRTVVVPVRKVNPIPPMMVMAALFHKAFGNAETLPDYDEELDENPEYASINLLEVVTTLSQGDELKELYLVRNH